MAVNARGGESGVHPTAAVEWARGGITVNAYPPVLVHTTVWGGDEVTLPRR